jgi:hypothetical protein
MAKVVTEKPRRGHAMHRGTRNTTTATRGRVIVMFDDDGDVESIDEMSCLSAVRVPCPNGSSHVRPPQKDRGHDKEFSDLIGPLRSYLLKQVGRPWNSIHREMSEVLDKRSLQGSHIWDHVGWEVTMDTQCIDGKVYAFKSFRGGWTEVDGLYVHPTTGLLCHKGRTSYPWTWAKTKKEKEHKSALAQLGIVPTSREDALRYRVDRTTVWERRKTVPPRAPATASPDAHWLLHTFQFVPEVRYTTFKWGQDRDIIVPAGFKCVKTKQAGHRDIRHAYKLLATSPF